MPHPLALLKIALSALQIALSALRTMRHVWRLSLIHAVDGVLACALSEGWVQRSVLDHSSASA